jgi:predicted ATPase/DNA-binding CsgD family transcriptional regulator
MNKNTFERVIFLGLPYYIVSYACFSRQAACLCFGGVPLLMSDAASFSRSFHEPGAVDNSLPYHNIPPQRTPFIGRESEVEEIISLLLSDDCRLMTLVGPGGIGKTRLAVQVAEQVLSKFADGVFFITLRSFDSINQLLAALANTLHFETDDEDGNQPSYLQYRGNFKEQLLGYLGKKQLLLVMDNFENVLVAADLVAEIVRVAPDVKVLATSREVMNLQPEWVHMVEGMKFPDSGESQQGEDYGAVQLFVQRARQVLGGFSLEDEQDCVIRICRLVGGMPLAIELAVTWLRTLSCAEIASEIENNVDILATSMRDIPERHRSIRAVFDSSWKMLSDDEKNLFMKLSVFRSNAMLEAIQAITGASLLTLSALVDKSLVKRTHAGNYRIHELLRQLAWQRLEASGEADSIRDAFSVYYCNFMQEREQALGGPQQLRVLNEIVTEFKNFRVGWYWAIKQRDHSSIGRAVECLCQFLWMRGSWDTGSRMLIKAQEAFAPRDDETPHPLWGRLLVRWWRDSAEPRNSIETALKIAKDTGDHFEIGLCLYQLASAMWNESDYEMTEQLLEDSLIEFQAAEDSVHVAEIFVSLGYMHKEIGDQEKALDFAAQSMIINKALENKYGLSHCIILMGQIEYLNGNLMEAERLVREADALARETGNRKYVAWRTIEIGVIYEYGMHGNIEEARRLVNEGYALAKNSNIGYAEAFALDFLSVFESLDENYQASQELGNQVATLSEGKPPYTWFGWGLMVLACGLGDIETAQRYNQEALQFYYSAKMDTDMLATMPVSAVILTYKGEKELAVRLLGRAYTHRKAMKHWLQDWPLLIRLQDDLQAEFGQDVYTELWAEGSAADIRTMVTNVLDIYRKDQGLGEHAPTEDERVWLANQLLVEPLSLRELEVLQSLVNGYSNREIAEQLFVGVSTVKKHITHIYGKLGIKSRTKAILQAKKLNLV